MERFAGKGDRRGSVMVNTIIFKIRLGQVPVYIWIHGFMNRIGGSMS